MEEEIKFYTPADAQISTQIQIEKAIVFFAGEHFDWGEDWDYDYDVWVYSGKKNVRFEIRSKIPKDGINLFDMDFAEYPNEDSPHKIKVTEICLAPKRCSMEIGLKIGNTLYNYWYEPDSEKEYQERHKEAEKLFSEKRKKDPLLRTY